jgi:predicted amidohydrolase
MSAITLSLIQTELVWESPRSNRDILEQKIRSLPKTEVVILPEMFTTGFSMDPNRLAEDMQGPTVQWMKQLAAEKKVILTGSVIIEEGGHYFNRLLWVLPNGQVGTYDKRHLFAFAGEDQHYTPGQKRFVASVNGWKVLVLVCYDLRFPVWSRQHMSFDGDQSPKPEYDLIIYVANWPERRSHAWKTLLQARAIENQCYVAAVNRVGSDGKGIGHSGDSMVVDPLGAVLATAAHEEWVHTITLERGALDAVRQQLPFLRDADRFNIQN